MLIDGNDDRGIDVALMTRRGYEIVDIASHVDDTDVQGEIFSRDCPEYTVVTPGGERVVLLVKSSKEQGIRQSGLLKQEAQTPGATGGADLPAPHLAGPSQCCCLGDFNDMPDSAPLAPLPAQTDLRDITTHPNFTSDGRAGTFGSGTKSNKIDYILLSPALFSGVTGGAIFRKGVWGGKHGTLFPHYPSITRPIEAASDHAAIYADIS